MQGVMRTATTPAPAGWARGGRVPGQDICGHCWSVMPGPQQTNVFFKNIGLS